MGDFQSRLEAFGHGIGVFIVGLFLIATLISGLPCWLLWSFNPLLGKVAYLITWCVLATKIVASFGIDSVRSIGDFYAYSVGVMILFVLVGPVSLMTFFAHGDFLMLAGYLASGVAILHGLGRLHHRLLASRIHQQDPDDEEEISDPVVTL